MSQKSHEIVILKPTAVFLAFLAAQLPTAKLPDLRLLQIDNTAYAIPKQNSDESTLDQMEKHFPTMFRHEICRWLGDCEHLKVETNFMDFLCCFKFELHNHLILLEPTFKESRQLLLLKPRLSLLDWIKKIAQEQEGEDVEVVERVQLVNLEENATALIKNFSNLTEIKPFLKSYYAPLFTTAMTRITSQSEQWPLINSYQDFNEFFAIEIHTQLIHLDD